MHRLPFLIAALLLTITSSSQLAHRPLTASLLSSYRQTDAAPDGVVGSAEAEDIPPVTEANELPRQRVVLHSLLNCADTGAEFGSSGNSFYEDFRPFTHNVHSATICGRAAVWFYSSPDMDRRSLVGGFHRCGKDGESKSIDECKCYELRSGSLVEAFDVEYC